MSGKEVRKFSTGASTHRIRQMSTLVEKEGAFGASLTVSPGVSLFTHLPPTRSWSGEAVIIRETIAMFGELPIFLMAQR
jgi:hypothetical protein